MLKPFHVKYLICLGKILRNYFSDHITPNCQINMSSSQSSSQSPGEEAYFIAEEDRSCYARSFSRASSTMTKTPNVSVYATADQTPTTSLVMSRGTASSIPLEAEYQGSFEWLRPIEERTEECRERAPLNLTAAQRESFFTHRVDASTYLKVFS